MGAGDLQQHDGKMEGELDMRRDLRRVARRQGTQPVLEIELEAAEGVDRQLGERGQARGDVALEECRPVAGLGVGRVVVLDVPGEALAEQDEVGEVALVG